nr:hypothetical protein pmam_151 [Pithovirus mammoth]
MILNSSESNLKFLMRYFCLLILFLVGVVSCSSKYSCTTIDSKQYCLENSDCLWCPQTSSCHFIGTSAECQFILHQPTLFSNLFFYSAVVISGVLLALLFSVFKKFVGIFI